MDDLSKNHATFLIPSHLIFVCKYRKKPRIRDGDEMKQLFEEIAARSDFSCEAVEVDQDHLHCIIKSEPRISPLAIVRTLKQVSTFRLWETYGTELKRPFWKEKPFGVMGIFAAPSGMQARRLSASTLKARDRRKVRRTSTRMKTSWMYAAPSIKATHHVVCY
jgi:putative transposase